MLLYPFTHIYVLGSVGMGIVVCNLIKNWDFNKKDKSSVFDVLVLILLFINFLVDLPFSESKNTYGINVYQKIRIKNE